MKIPKFLTIRQKKKQERDNHSGLLRVRFVFKT